MKNLLVFSNKHEASAFSDVRHLILEDTQHETINFHIRSMLNSHKLSNIPIENVILLGTARALSNNVNFDQVYAIYRIKEQCNSEMPVTFQQNCGSKTWNYSCDYSANIISSATGAHCEDDRKLLYEGSYSDFCDTVSYGYASACSANDVNLEIYKIALDSVDKPLTDDYENILQEKSGKLREFYDKYLV